MLTNSALYPSLKLGTEPRALCFLGPHSTTSSAPPLEEVTRPPVPPQETYLFLRLHGTSGTGAGIFNEPCLVGYLWGQVADHQPVLSNNFS